MAAAGDSNELGWPWVSRSEACSHCSLGL